LATTTIATGIARGSSSPVNHALQAPAHQR
jgi:hypothetical protein